MGGLNGRGGRGEYTKPGGCIGGGTPASQHVLMHVSLIEPFGGFSHTNGIPGVAATVCGTQSVHTPISSISEPFVNWLYPRTNAGTTTAQDSSGSEKFAASDPPMPRSPSRYMVQSIGGRGGERGALATGGG